MMCSTSAALIRTRLSASFSKAFRLSKQPAKQKNLCIFTSLRNQLTYKSTGEPASGNKRFCCFGGAAEPLWLGSISESLQGALCAHTQGTFHLTPFLHFLIVPSLTVHHGVERMGFSFGETKDTIPTLSPNSHVPSNGLHLGMPDWANKIPALLIDWATLASHPFSESQISYLLVEDSPSLPGQVL